MEAGYSHKKLNELQSNITEVQIGISEGGDHRNTITRLSDPNGNIDRLKTYLGNDAANVEVKFENGGEIGIAGLRVAADFKSISAKQKIASAAGSDPTVHGDSYVFSKQQVKAAMESITQGRKI